MCMKENEPIRFWKTKEEKMAKIYDVMYKKEFFYKDKAEQFIESHKKQDCFDLEYNFSNYCWIVKKLKFIGII